MSFLIVPLMWLVASLTAASGHFFDTQFSLMVTSAYVLSSYAPFINNTAYHIIVYCMCCIFQNSNGFKALFLFIFFMPDFALVFSFSRDNGLDYLEFRLWIGLWSAFLCLILVATDASSLVKYFTRFTEEGFACLISFIFIYDAFKTMIKFSHYYPINSDFTVYDATLFNCACLPKDPSKYLQILLIFCFCYMCTQKNEIWQLQTFLPFCKRLSCAFIIYVCLRWSCMVKLNLKLNTILHCQYVLKRVSCSSI